MKRISRTWTLLAGSLLLLGVPVACRATTVASAPTVARHHSQRIEAIDVEHYALELNLMPETRAIEGRCTVRFIVVSGPVEEIVLDLEGLAVSAVQDGRGAPLYFEHHKGELEIRLASVLLTGDLGEVVVEYGGQPAKGLWFVDGDKGKVRQVFTQGECVDAHWWFPCLDFPSDRATSEIRVSMPSNWVGVAAGERIDLRETVDRRVEHWRMATPHPTYLMTLCAGEFRVLEEEWDGIPLSYLADPRYGNWMQSSFAETKAILAFFSEVTGKRYPYPKYSQTCVGNFPFGGMENISATTMTENTLTDELGQRDGTSHGLVAHEAAHQWFGDLITCADWSEIWLNEGFATYMTHLYFERTRGVDEFRVRLRNDQVSYTAADVGKDRRPTVHNFYKDPFDLFFDGKAYSGGAARLHLLRFELGDEQFFEGLRLYVAENEGRSVRTEDLQSAMETVSTRDLGPFFQQWFHTAGYPELDVRWNWDEGLGQVNLSVNQVQLAERGTPATFRFGVDVELRNATGRQITRLQVSERRQVFALPSNSRPIWVRFDKYSVLPARIASQKTSAEWMAIAAEDDDVNGRRDAVVALGRFLETEADPERAAPFRTAILRRLRDDTSEAVRLAAVEAFGRKLDSDAQLFLEKAISEDLSAEVRETGLKVLTGLGISPELASFAERVFDEGYSSDVRIAAARLYASAAPQAAHDWILARTDLPSPHAKLRAGLVSVLATVPDTRVMPELHQLAVREDLATATRRAAVVGIGARGSRDVASRDLLLALLGTNDYQLRQDVIDALAGFRDAVVHAKLRQVHAASLHSRERRKLEAAMERIGSGAQ